MNLSAHDGYYFIFFTYFRTSLKTLPRGEISLVFIQHGAVLFVRFFSSRRRLYLHRTRGPEVLKIPFFFNRQHLKPHQCCSTLFIIFVIRRNIVIGYSITACARDARRIAKKARDDSFLLTFPPGKGRLRFSPHDSSSFSTSS